VFTGRLIGAEKVAVGEVVFTTAVVGYPQALTDPSYKGQILVFTMPLIGNYGVSEDQFESDGIKAEGVVVFEATAPSHYKSVMSLEEWLAAEGVPGLARVDTRALAMRLREHGVLMGALGPEEPDELLKRLRASMRYEEVSYVDLVSVKEPRELGDGRLCVGVVDCGVKRSILTEFLKRGVRLKVVPCRRPELAFDCDALFVSNGPGNPKLLDFLVRRVREFAEYKKPLFGICLGHQVIAMAFGAEVYKMKFGHRASNKPVKDMVFTEKTYITVHNHGYAVDPRDSGLKVWAVQPDDGTVEGLYHESLPILTTQFHPEASPGPQDVRWVFDMFMKRMERHAGR
jgi:carbamoyl-phosphate synthase small subunit